MPGQTLFYDTSRLDAKTFQKPIYLRVKASPTYLAFVSNNNFT